jgi:hypothetical protein
MPKGAIAAYSTVHDVPGHHHGDSASQMSSGREPMVLLGGENAHCLAYPASTKTQFLPEA